MQENGVGEQILETGTTESPLKIKGRNKIPTPGGPLTEERIKDLGVIKMNDYLISGTRPQFWEEYYVKVIMHVSFSSFKLLLMLEGDFKSYNIISSKN